MVQQILLNTPELSNVNLSDGTELEIDGGARPTLDVRAGVDQSVIGTPATALGGLFLDANFTPRQFLTRHRSRTPI